VRLGVGSQLLDHLCEIDDRSILIGTWAAASCGEQAQTRGTMHGFGRQNKPLFWIVGNAKVGQATHFAFIAQTRDQVDAFYHAALAAGGTDNGAPGIRRYHENYYGAFVHDPDGINIEAVCNAAP
jgi:catechol 2,3-dioxygenase-like lactoylglutathione lyase family enzyme